MTTTNRYYRVTKPFRLYLRVGLTKSNTYIGASMAYGNVWREVEAVPGTELHLLVGGSFYVTPEDSWYCRVVLNGKHLFEKVYVPREQPWPTDALLWIDKEALERRVPDDAGKFSEEELAAVYATRYGRGDDYIIPLDFDFEVTLTADLDSQASPRAAAEAAAEWLLNQKDGAGQASFHLRDKLTGRVWAVDLRQPPETDHVVSVNQNPQEGR